MRNENEVVLETERPNKYSKSPSAQVAPMDDMKTKLTETLNKRKSGKATTGLHFEKHLSEIFDAVYNKVEEEKEDKAEYTSDDERECEWVKSIEETQILMENTSTVNKSSDTLKFEKLCDKFADYTDQYVKENLGDDFEDTPWLATSIEEAEEYKSFHTYEGGNANFSKVQMTAATNLGPGVPLYFQFLKTFTFAFFAMSLLSLPALFFAANGSRIASRKNMLGISLFEQLSIGNIGLDPESSAYNANAACASARNNACLAVFGRVTMYDVSIIIMSMEILQIVVFMIAYLHLRWCYFKSHGKTSVTDYSIMVRDLPMDTTVEQLVVHFSDLYQLQGVSDWRKRLPIRFAKPVLNVGNTNDNFYKGKWVAECTISREIGCFVNTCKIEQLLMDKLFRHRAEMKMYAPNTTHSLGPNALQHSAAKLHMLQTAKEIDEIRMNFMEREKKLVAADVESQVGGTPSSFTPMPSAVTFDTSSHATPHRTPHAAFITFQYSESMARCIEDYREFAGYPDGLYPKELLFSGKKLRVTSAPKPGDVLWENLEIPSTVKNLKRMSMYAAVCAVVALSFVCVVLVLRWSERGDTLRSVPYLIMAVQVLVNPFILLVLDYFRVKQYHSSIDTSNKVFFSSNFAVQYFQLVVVPIVAFWAGQLLLFERYSNFSAKWYGVFSIVLNGSFFIKALMPLSQALLEYFVVRPLKGFFLYSALAIRSSYAYPMQKDLDTLAVGPSFDLPWHSSHTVSILFFGMSFAAAFPLLNILLCFTFMSYFQGHKFLLCRYYRRPRLFGVELMKITLDYLPWAAVVRLCVGYWMFHMSNVFTNGNGGSDMQRITKSNAFPLLVVVSIMVGLKFMCGVLDAFGVRLKDAFKYCSIKVAPDDGLLHPWTLLQFSDVLRNEVAPFAGNYFMLVCDLNEIPHSWLDILIDMLWKRSSVRSLCNGDIISGWAIIEMFDHYLGKVKTHRTSLDEHGDGVVHHWCLGKPKKTYMVIDEQDGMYSYSLKRIPAYKLCAGKGVCRVSGPGNACFSVADLFESLLQERMPIAERCNQLRYEKLEKGKGDVGGHCTCNGEHAVHASATPSAPPQDMGLDTLQHSMTMQQTVVAMHVNSIHSNTVGDSGLTRGEGVFHPGVDIAPCEDAGVHGVDASNTDDCYVYTVAQLENDDHYSSDMNERSKPADIATST